MYIQTTPSRYSRALDNHEILYVNFAAKFYDIGKENLNITASLSCEVPGSWSSTFTKNRARLAWQGLRFRYPGIALKVDDGQIYYDVPSPSELEVWSDSTLRFHEHDGTTHDDLLAKGEILKSVHLHIIFEKSEKASSSSQPLTIVLRTPHYLNDVISSFATLNKFVAILAAPPSSSSLTWGTEPERLPPSLEEAASCPKTPDPVHTANALEYLKVQFNALPGLGLPEASFPDAKPGPTVHASITVSREDTAKIIAACKAKGYTVSAAALVSLVRLSNARQPSGAPLKDRVWVGGAALNLRQVLAVPKDPEAYNQGPYVTATYTLIDPQKNFDDMAREVSAQWKSAKNEETVRGCAEWARQNVSASYKSKGPLLWKMLLLCPWSFMKLLFFYGGKLPPMTRVGLGSIGVIDKYVKPKHKIEEDETGNVEIRRVRFDLEILESQLPTYAWTWNGQLELSTCWNSAFHEADVGAKLLADWKHMLGQDLDIELS